MSASTGLVPMVSTLVLQYITNSTELSGTMQCTTEAGQFAEFILSGEFIFNLHLA